MLNRVALIFGPNGSGKTTVLNALRALRVNIVTSSKNDPDDKIVGYEPHKLRQGDPCTIEVNFIKNGIKYYYAVSYTAKDILSESLYYSPNGRSTKIFSREGLNFEFSNSFAKYSQNFQNGLLQRNKLLLSVAANNTDSEEILAGYKFFKNDIVTYGNMSYKLSDKYLSEKSEYQNKFIEIMNDVGIDVDEIIVEEKPFDLESIPKRLLARFESSGAKLSELSTTKVSFVNSLFALDLEDESLGTKNMYSFLGVYLKSLETGKVLLCDELESSLHPEIVRYFIEKMLVNKVSSAQFIGTTHSIELLDQSIVRRDQIYFTELEKEKRSTCLYSLSDIKNVRNTENLRSNYLAGKYGAIPLVEECLEDDFDE